MMNGSGSRIGDEVLLVFVGLPFAKARSSNARPFFFRK